MFFGAIIDSHSHSAEIALVFEQLHGESLQCFIGVPPDRPDTRIRHHVILDVCSAMRYLHTTSPCIVHGDLKASNVFVEFVTSPTPRSKLLDFGLSRLITRHVQILGGTKAWEAPECLKDRKIRPSPAADVFSLGLLARFIITGLKPQRTDPSRCWPPIHADWFNVQPPIHADVGLLKECIALCSECLQPDAIHRPDVATIHAIVLAWRSDHVPPSPIKSTSSAGGLNTLTWKDALCRVRRSLTHELRAEKLVKTDFATVDPGQNCLWLDLALDGYPILACTKSCIGAFGPVGPRFLTWVSDAPLFEEWIQTCINEQSSGDVVSTPTIQTRFRSPAGFSFVGKCLSELLVPHDDEDDGCASMCISRVTLSDLQFETVNTPQVLSL